MSTFANEYDRGRYDGYLEGDKAAIKRERARLLKLAEGMAAASEAKANAVGRRGGTTAEAHGHYMAARALRDFIRRATEPEKPAEALPSAER